jgi:tetratricopeptide (TPR) repeat protein
MMRRAVRIVAAAALVATGLAAGEGARAAPTDAEAAESRRHYGIAVRAYDLAEYEEALREFKEAYRIVGDPAFLFNIAQCHRKLGHPADAISFYKTYLRRAPNSPHRAEVDRLIADLEKGEAARPEAAAPAAPAPAAPAPAAAVTSQTSAPVAPPPPSAPAALVVASGAPPEPATDRPFYTRAWFWVATSAALAGVATAAFLLTRPDPAATAGPFACPDCIATTPIGR